MRERERLLTVGCCSTIFVIIEEMWFDQDLRMKIFQKVTGDNRLVAVLNKIWNVFHGFNVSHLQRWLGKIVTTT